MSRARAAEYAGSLQRNISLYFPFLAYYQISYYKSDLFDAIGIGRLLQQGFPVDLQEALGDTWPAAKLTLEALVSTALIAADPEGGASPRSTWLIGDADDWLSLDWPKEVDCQRHRRFCWPVFGALALLRDTAWRATGVCEAAGSFPTALKQAVQSNEVVPLQQSLDLLQAPEGICGEGAPVLKATATLAVADWARRTALQRGGLTSSAREGLQRAIARAQSLLVQALPGDANLLGLPDVSALPGGSEIFWMLDRIQCSSLVNIVGRAQEFWMGADNVGMRNDVDISYQLFVFPYRELVSDFLRARKVPYCNESILRVVQVLARRLHRTRAAEVQVMEIGANLGDCSLWLAKRMQAVPSLRRIKVLALEALPAAAAVFQRSVDWNNLSHIIEVANVAASHRKGTVSLQAKPMSSNSYTLAEGSSSDFAKVPTTTLDDITPSAKVDLIVSHTNGQELSVLRGAMRILKKSRKLMIVLQLYGPQSGVIRDPSRYDPCRPVRWLANRGFKIFLSHRKALRLEVPGVLRRYFAEGQQVVNVIAVRKRYRRLLSQAPVVSCAPRGCIDLAKGQRPSSWAEVDGRVLRENLHIVRIYLQNHFGADAPPIGAVLKANAYGHGAVLAGRVLASAKIDALFVSEVETGLILRTAPEVSMALPMVLLYRSPGATALCKLAEANITVSILSMAWLRQALSWASCRSRVRCHIMVDTGLNREGLGPEEVADAARLLLQHPKWSLDGFYTHWCCVYDPIEMHRSLALFKYALRQVQDARSEVGAAGKPFTVHTSSSSSILFGTHYDLLRLGGLLFGDPVAISDGTGGTMRLPGPHRTLLWKSKITTLRWAAPGERFSRCLAKSGCEQSGPVFEQRVLLGTIPVGAYEFSDSNIVSSHFREKLTLLEKSTDALLVEIPSTSRTFHHAFEGMEVLLCAENCVQGLFNVPEHIPRILVQDPSIEFSIFCPSELSRLDS